jgi:lysophospholipase L1-like esterase
VLSQARPDIVILMMGINDISWPDTILMPEGKPAATADDIIAGYKQLIARAHDHDMTILGATLTLSRPPAVWLLQRREGGEAAGGQRVDPHQRRVRRRD